VIPAVRRPAYNGRVSGLTPEEAQMLVALLTQTRWAALATARDDEPLASWVAVVGDPEPGHYLLHLSHLALHTRFLLVNSRASLAFSEPDRDPDRDPQTLARASLTGRVVEIARDSADYLAGRARYLAALPASELQFGLGDFYLMRFETDSARFVPGFGRAHRLGIEALNTLLTPSP
jgi:putative heme iron utilization protein